MPNWCDNELRIYGPKTERARLLEFIRQEVKNYDDDGDTPNNKPKTFDPLSFDKIIPYPEEFKAQDKIAHEESKRVSNMSSAEQTAYHKRHGWLKVKDGYNSGGYEWCCHNWGTKWPACDTFVEHSKRSVCISFQTAWSPPHPIVDKLAELFPKVKLSHKFWECGAGYKGRYDYANGHRVSEIDEDYRGNRGG